MSDLIWTPDGVYIGVPYASEADLEDAILQVSDTLFGKHRLYFDVKKKIGRFGKRRNIPDGYLLDLSGRKPRLYVVENELASHDPLKHIATQILEFSLSFETDGHGVKKILFEAIRADPAAKELCAQYAGKHGYRNIDRLLEYLVFETPFAALVIIDEIPPKLERVLAEKFRFGVEVLSLARFENTEGVRLYQFTPFLFEVEPDTEDAASGKHAVDVGELDTLVVPAREDGFQETFLDEDRWYAIRINGTMRPQIKYIAAYRVAPLSAITHIAKVASIEPWGDTGKYVVNFEAPAQELPSPIRLVKKGRVKAPQNIRYTTYTRLKSAKTLDDLW